MEVITACRGGPRGQIKAKTEDEFLVKIGAKEEEFDWDEKIVNEPLRRPTSFVCIDYQRTACYRRKPRTVSENIWNNRIDACRQLNKVSRYGPRRFYINNQNIHTIGDNYLKGSFTQTLGLCYSPQRVSSL